jgi:Outer membrane efflux protein
VIGASRANFFPKFTLIALGGTQDAKFRLYDAITLFGSVGPSIDIPLFDAGLRQAPLEIAKAQFTQAAVLRALKELQVALSSLRWLAEEYSEIDVWSVDQRSRPAACASRINSGCESVQSSRLVASRRRKTQRAFLKGQVRSLEEGSSDRRIGAVGAHRAFVLPD